MALEELKAQIAMLLESLEDNPQDPHELLEILRQHLAQTRAMGLPVPDDLAKLEKDLEAQFAERK